MLKSPPITHIGFEVISTHPVCPKPPTLPILHQEIPPDCSTQSVHS